MSKTKMDGTHNRDRTAKQVLQRLVDPYPIMEARRRVLLVSVAHSVILNGGVLSMEQEDL